MGHDATGILAYGYDLGESPTYVGLNEYETPGWLDEDEHNDLGDAFERRLLDASGFTERWESRRDDGYHTREREAREALGVQMVRNGCEEAPNWILAAHVITEDWGDTRVVDPQVLIADVGTELQRNQRLAWAVEALGIRTEGGPAWLLSADYG